MHNYYADYKKTAPSVMNEYWPGWNKRLVESGLYGHEKGQIDTMGKCEIIICNSLMKLLVKHISCSMKLDYCSSTGESCYLLVPICFLLNVDTTTRQQPNGDSYEQGDNH